MKRILYICICLLCAGTALRAQSLEENVRRRLSAFFAGYTTAYADIGACKLDRFRVDHEAKTLQVYANSAFGYQPFTEANTQAIYRSIRQMLPGPVNYYAITVYADGQPIENLVPNAFRDKTPKDKSRLYGKTDYRGDPWVKNLSKPYEADRGLENRHIAVWQSHGRYYKNACGEWRWQRPRLFGTTEDLFTQTFVVPYLIPMLENAGAVVFTPRERDWQRNEVVVDNDVCPQGSFYLEANYKRKYRWQDTSLPGFAQKYTCYTDCHNPFRDGTARFIRTQEKPEKAFAEWVPCIPEAGRYAVYVSYQTLPESVSDARYTVFHKGGATEFRVNQQMGGGTWVYLGTFEFDRGANDYGMVVLSNESRQKGVVCADAVRFGGGMGNIARGGRTSGFPRYLEGARYWAQWAGMPYEVYSKSKGANDYNDDINARSLTVNYLSGGSAYNPSEKGLGVPLELAFALHSDAGFKTDGGLVGSLGIYTTDANGGKVNCGVSRYASRDLTDMVLTGLQRDISSRFGIQWARRGMWNRNYSETRLPAVPSMILETLSHQNFADMKWGHDPEFKFTVARSVYKSLLRYTASMHGTAYTVQPLPVRQFAIREGRKQGTFELRWAFTPDPAEPTAEPQGYIVYTRIGRGGFDNGTYVKSPRYTMQAEPGLVYSFKVTAVNRGGESFPSGTLSACHVRRSRGTLLIVDGFRRTCGPATVETSTLQGFDMQADPGLPYVASPAFCGYQQGFSRAQAGVETEGGLGYSGSELEGLLVAGNTRDYAFVHGKAIQTAGKYSFVSCSIDALERDLSDLSRYAALDLLLGEEKERIAPDVRDALEAYCEGGGRLLASGSYLNECAGEVFARRVLKCVPASNLYGTASGEVYGTGIRFSIPRTANGEAYAVPSPGCLLPVGGAFSAFVYTEGKYSAGTAYRGTCRTFVLGFPFESIRGAEQRAHVMRSALGFLLGE